ncbi:hypothetical protein WN51_11729 [Melipona quadrifasciata]|uniref:Uncharacterized protein n=1 Tax=Melipona quadrifasciata TaxID=166423 RepID=A0A0N0BHP8_9HYME|nr:hypothetical protein WN51_11729 [Melipona quadrifasciata]
MLSKPLYGLESRKEYNCQIWQVPNLASTKFGKYHIWEIPYLGNIKFGKIKEENRSLRGPRLGKPARSVDARETLQATKNYRLLILLITLRDKQLKHIKMLVVSKTRRFQLGLSYAFAQTADKRSIRRFFAQLWRNMIVKSQQEDNTFELARINVLLSRQITRIPNNYENRAKRATDNSSQELSKFSQKRIRMTIVSFHEVRSLILLTKFQNVLHSSHDTFDKSYHKYSAYFPSFFNVDEEHFVPTEICSYSCCAEYNAVKLIAASTSFKKERETNGTSSVRLEQSSIIYNNNKK